MYTWQILVGNLPVKEGVDPCPWGLLVPSVYGNGVDIHRCKLLAGHKEPHYEKVTYPQESRFFVRVTTQWEVVKNLLTRDDDDGHEPPAVRRDHHGSEP
jgi:hypothetical protein